MSRPGDDAIAAGRLAKANQFFRAADEIGDLKAGYTHRSVTVDERKRAERAAAQLVDAARST
jgi:hypothetical protein